MSILKKSFSSIQLLIIIGVTSMFSSCVAPVNLNYESARMMKKGGVEVQGSWSTYSVEGEKTNTNMGGKIGFGITDKYNLKLRLEALITPKSTYGGGFSSEFTMLYLELDNKINLSKNFALSLPIGYYSSMDASGFAVFDPRLYITFRSADVFEFTIIPKTHIFLGDGFAFMPGISVGFGVSSDLNKWAIRPEVGYDSYFSVGIGFSYFLNKK